MENLKIFMFFEVRKKFWRDGPILTADLESGGTITSDIMYRMNGIWHFFCVLSMLIRKALVIDRMFGVHVNPMGELQIGRSKV